MQPPSRSRMFKVFLMSKNLQKSFKFGKFNQMFFQIFDFLISLLFENLLLEYISIGHNPHQIDSRLQMA